MNETSTKQREETFAYCGVSASFITSISKVCCSGDKLVVAAWYASGFCIWKAKTIVNKPSHRVQAIKQLTRQRLLKRRVRVHVVERAEVPELLLDVLVVRLVVLVDLLAGLLLLEALALARALVREHLEVGRVLVPDVV